MISWKLFDLIEVLCEKEIQEYRVSVELPEEFEENRYTYELCDYELEEIFEEKYNISIFELEKFIIDLLPLCDCAKSELTDKVYRGFRKDNMWIIKKEV